MRQAAGGHRPAALAEPELLYLVVVTLAAGHESSDELGRLYADMDKLVPLKTEARDDRLSCWLLCTAPTAHAAAWKTVKAVQAATNAMLLLVEAGLPGEPAPELVLIRDGSSLPGGEGAVGAD